MLHDPKWDTRNLRTLVDWLMTKDPRTTYNFRDVGDCVIVRHLEGSGVGYGRFEDPIVRSYVAGEKPHTYGAVLRRALETLERGEG